MNVKIGVVVVLSFVGASLFGQTKGGVEDWTDVTGEYSIVAEFVSLEGEEVMLKKENGEVVKIPLDKLSASHAARARRLGGVELVVPPVKSARRDSSVMDDAFGGEPAPTIEVEIMDEGENRGIDREFTEGEKQLMQERLDEMETPGKTAMWEFVRWVSVKFEGENAEIHFTENGVDVRFDPTRSSSNTISSLVPDRMKLDFVAPVLLIGCYLAMLICGLWYLLEMFRVSVWWGLSNFVPCVGSITALVFLFKYWDEAKRPFLWSLFFTAGFVAACFLFPSWAPEYAVLEQALLNAK